MKMAILLTAIVTSCLSGNVFADLVSADVYNAAADFGLEGKMTDIGVDEDGRKCQILVKVEREIVTIYGQKWINVDGIKSAGVSTFDGYKITKLDYAGTKRAGIFAVQQEYTVKAHITDLGLYVPTYKVNKQFELVYKNGKLFSADISTTRPGLSKLVIDPDFYSGNVRNCRIQ